MKTPGDVAAFIRAQPEMRHALDAVAALGLPDCWIAAGFIRNAVWDKLHDRPYVRDQSDVDVIYFDAADRQSSRDEDCETLLRRNAPQFDWSVKNQARMHAANGDAPYRDAADAMIHWPEICTAIAARKNGRRVEILAPFGIEDLLTLRVRPTLAFRDKMPIYRQRQIDKAWTANWPLLKVTEL